MQASVQCVCGKNMCWGCGKSTDDCADGVECEAADEEGMTESDEAFADESMDDYSTDDDMLDERSQQDDAGITQLESRLKDHESTASTTSMHQQQQGPSNQDTVEAKPSREQEGHQQLLDQSSSRQPLASTNQPSLPGPQAHSKEARKSQTSKESPKDPAQAIIDSDRRDARDMYFGEEPNEAEYNFPICDHQFDPYVDCQGDFGMTRNKYLECHHCWSRVKASRTRPSTGGQSRGGSKTPRSSSAPRQDPRVEAQSEYDARPKAYVCTQCGIMFCTNCTLATQAARHNALLPT